MILTLKEVKEYLRVDFDDEDDLISGILHSAEELCAYVARKRVDELSVIESDTIRTAVMYATAYMYEHREKADHNALVLTLRALLFGIREEAF